MRPRRHPAAPVLAFGLMGLILAACGAAAPSQSVTSPVSQDEALAMSQQMLEAYNDGDYAAWSADWSQVMKEAIPEDAFAAFRSETMANAGGFDEIESISSRPGDAAGVVRWESNARFENGTYVFMIAFKEGSRLIEGVNLVPAS